MQISCNCEACQTNRPSQTKESPVNQQLVDQLNAELTRLGFPTIPTHLEPYAEPPTTPSAQDQSAYLREEAERLVGQAKRLLDQADELDAEEEEDDGIGPQEQKLADNFLGELDWLFKGYRVEQVPEGLLISDGGRHRVIVEWKDMFQVE